MVTTHTAVRLACAALRKVRQTYAFEHNLVRLGAESPEMQRAARKYDRITDAMAVLHALGSVASGATEWTGKESEP